MKLPRRRASKPDAKRVETGLRASEVAAWLCEVLEHTDGWINAQDLCEVLFGAYGMIEPAEALSQASERFDADEPRSEPMLQHILGFLDTEERAIAVTADLSVKEAVATLAERGLEVTVNELKRKRAALKEKLMREFRLEEQN